MGRSRLTDGYRLKIVSGGQTGVDRAALDVAFELRLPCGGWCPRGRRAEDGPIQIDRWVQIEDRLGRPDWSRPRRARRRFRAAFAVRRLVPARTTRRGWADPDRQMGTD